MQNHLPSRFRESATLFVFVTCIFHMLPMTSEVRAQSTCVASSQFLPIPEERYYRIATATADYLPGVTRDEFDFAVRLAADIWNEQANGPYFRSGPSSDPLPLPATGAGCPHSQVVVRNFAGPTAEIFPACDGAYFTIYIYARDPFGQPIDYVVGEDFTANSTDLVWVLAHEFGHALGLHHPLPSSVAASSQVNLPVISHNSRGRELFQSDLECVEQLLPRRNLRRVSRTHSSGVLSAESVWLPPVALSSGSVGLNWPWTGGPPQHDWAARIAPCLAWSPGVGGSSLPLICLGSAAPPETGAVLRSVVWREDTTQDRVFFASHLDYPTAYDEESRHRVRYVRSQQDFLDFSPPSGYLRHCTAMSGWLSCLTSNTDYIYTSKPVAVAWDNYNDASLTVWANEDRGQTEHTREVWFATGVVNNWTVPTPSSLGVRSSVAPGAACNAYSAGGYDCIIAYVDQADGTGQVRVRRLWSSAGANAYIPHLAPTSAQVGLNMATTTAIAVWFHDNRFWVAARRAASYQLLEVFSSSDGLAWTYEGQFGRTVVGPTAIGYWTGDNRLMYFR